METQHQNPFRRLPSHSTPAARPLPHATKAQSVIEYALFTVFGGAVLFAPLALVLAKTPSHRSVPNLFSMGMAADRVNVLTIVAPPGRNVSTDALMLVSIKPSTRDVAVISIPGDLWVRLGRHGTRRLGTGVAVGRTSGYPGGGPGLLTDTVSEVLRQPVHAFVELDSEDLTRIIDGVGGIRVEVPRGAYESRTGDRFPRGYQHLDGLRAVRFSLSRRMAGQANDRFEREARQRAVIAALLSSLPRALPLEADLDDALTNLTPAQIAWLGEAAAAGPIRTLTFAPYVDVFDVSTLMEAGEALRPRGGFAQLQQVAANAFSR